MPRILSSKMSIYKKKMWEVALNEKLYLDAEQGKTRDYIHFKKKKLLMLLARRDIKV